MSWFAVGAALLAATATYYNEQQVAHRQDQQAAAGIRLQQQKQHKADAANAELLKQMAASNPEDERQSQLDAYVKTLQLGSQANGINQGVGGFSDEYRKQAADDAAGLQAYGADRAGLLARIDAPVLQRRGEGVLFDNTKNDINMIARAAEGDAFINQLKLNAIGPNPWISAGASLLNGYAGARSGRGGDGFWGTGG